MGNSLMYITHKYRTSNFKVNCRLVSSIISILTPLIYKDQFSSRKIRIKEAKRWKRPISNVAIDSV